MKLANLACIGLLSVSGILGAQTPLVPPTPQVLPPMIINLPTPEPATLPIIRNGTAPKPPTTKHEVLKFSSEAITVDKVDQRYHVKSGEVLIHDFGYDRFAAQEAARLMREQRINQQITIPGSRPAFQVWLVDGKPSVFTANQQMFMPLLNMALRAQQIGGVWIITDGSRSLYDFGADEEAAKQAAELLQKFGFNQLGIVGNPKPVFLYPIRNELLAKQQQSNLPPNTMSTLGVIDDVAKQNLILPGNVFVGKKTPLDANQLQVIRSNSGEWFLKHQQETLAKFGSQEYTARAAMKAIIDSKATEFVRVGGRGTPIFLANGLPIKGRPFGAMNTDMRPDRLKLSQIRDSWWLTEDNRPVLHGGTKTEAEVLLKTVKSLNLKTQALFGHIDNGGLLFLTTGY